jgi:hypothetical protein
LRLWQLFTNFVPADWEKIRLVASLIAEPGEALLKKRMRSEVLRHRDLIAENLSALIRMFRAAIVAANPDLLGRLGNGERRIGVGLC